ncbi:O-methyltransferase [Oryzibacter oryziterrae]|uniref:O-methyltransferase n=1 Tax=Oryzibacter oryziterrae TaxID=2766474 RepID=UPI001F1E3DC8|nr:O-methyltransferase [Oryzibacter oryziterrae]
MNGKHWTAVDTYITDQLIPADAALDAALSANQKAGLPAHDVSPPQGKFLQLLALAIGARRILEIGTLGGYSTIWLARALPDGGRLVTLEAEPRHAEVARGNIARAGLTHLIDLRVGPALDHLPAIEAEALGPFDLVFIDADKPNNPAYLEWALRLTRPGSLIIGDNVVRDGAVVDPDYPDARVQGIRRFFDDIAANPRLSATALQTVGAKGWDGFAMALVL